MRRIIDIAKIERSADCISGYDAMLNIVIWNSAVAKKYSITKKDAIGCSLLELFPHIEDDFRYQCFGRAAGSNEEFFFSALPYLFEEGTYTQLIIPRKGNRTFDVLSIVRDHIGEERYSKSDILGGILQETPQVAFH